MKHTFPLALLLSAAMVSCGPSRHAIPVDMRYPSKSGLELAGKNLSVVYLAGGDKQVDEFTASMADGFAYALEEDYDTGEGSVGVFSMEDRGGSYSDKDTLMNLLMDTGADVVFLFDKVELGEMAMGGLSHIATASSPDSSYLSTGVLKFSLQLYAFDAMNKAENVYTFAGSSFARPDVLSNGLESQETLVAKAYEALPAEAWEAGKTVAASFEPQWKTEQYSIVYYDGKDWYDALARASSYDWRGAMDIWMELMDTRDLLKRSCAEYNMAVACYMLGDYSLAQSWLDRSDSDNVLPLSAALRKRIEARR